MSEASKPKFVLPGLELGLTGRREFVVSDAMTAHAMEAEGLMVLATPLLGKEIELACVAAIQHLLPPSMISLGSELSFKHLTGSPVGARVVCTARLEAIDGRRLRFAVEARDDFDQAAQGMHERFIADRARLFEKITEKKARLSAAPIS
jgi:fluoroacetyl-CoA thioesterase